MYIFYLDFYIFLRLSLYAHFDFLLMNAFFCACLSYKFLSSNFMLSNNFGLTFPVKSPNKMPRVLVRQWQSKRISSTSVWRPLKNTFYKRKFNLFLTRHLEIVQPFKNYLQLKKKRAENRSLVSSLNYDLANFGPHIIITLCGWIRESREEINLDFFSFSFLFLMSGLACFSICHNLTFLQVC